MKVRVKEGKIGFIYGKLRHGDSPDRKPDEFTLKAFEHPKKLDDKGDPLVVSVEQQFSKAWMEEVNPKKKVKVEEKKETKKTEKKS
jgi:hypothetical protein